MLLESAASQFASLAWHFELSESILCLVVEFCLDNSLGPISLVLAGYTDCVWSEGDTEQFRLLKWRY